MNNLFILNEILTNKYNIGFLDLLSVFTVICGIYTIISKNPIISILFLIGLFGGISSYLILIGLSFIGLSYLIIYIGAVSILFLFILMLINIRISELHNYNKNSIPLALIITILLSSSIFPILPYNIEVKKDLFINNDLYFSSSNDWNGNIIDINHMSNIGNILYTSYNLWLIMTGYILLLAMVGAIIITIKK